MPFLCGMLRYPALGSSALILILPFAVQAQIPIAEARDLPIGSVVTVNGIITAGNELGTVRYLQDGTAGIAAFPGAGSQPGFAPARGTDITITGELTLYNGLLEITPVTSFTINSTGNTLPVPQQITPQQLDESRESELVRINGCLFDEAGGTFSSGTSGFTSNGQAAVIYLRGGHPLVGTTIPWGEVDLVGITSQYAPDEPAIGGYQLLPREAADLIASSTITFNGPVLQTAIVPDGFTLQWPTNLAGDSHVSYGLTPALGSEALNTGNTIAHSVALSGLQSAAFYYAQCWSVDGNDTTWSSIGLYSTASAIAGDIKVYFNHSVDHSVATGPLANDIGDAIEDTIRAYIDRAQLTLDYAVYNTTTNSIVAALNDAHDRGVQVRVIAEGSNSNSALDNLDPLIPRLFRTDGEGSGMHNKFLSIDADIPEAARLLTGSTNCTGQSLFTDANNLVVVHDQALARAYRLEFEEMWGSNGPQPNAGNSLFGWDKSDNTPHLFNVGGSLIESSFSPSDGTTARIASALHSVDEHIEFALFAFTSSLLADALIEEQSQGASVRGLLDEDQLDEWIMDQLLDGDVNVLLDGDPDALLHHKYAIVDRDVAGGDPLVITGSHNWSYSAETINDENTLIIHDAAVANQYYQEWSARWGLVSAVPGLNATAAGTIIAPNPANDILRVRTNGVAKSFSILDAAGRVILEGPIASTESVLDVSHLAEGSYTLVTRSNERRSSARFVIAR